MRLTLEPNLILEKDIVSSSLLQGYSKVSWDHYVNDTNAQNENSIVHKFTD